MRRGSIAVATGIMGVVLAALFLGYVLTGPLFTLEPREKSREEVRGQTEGSGAPAANAFLPNETQSAPGTASPPIGGVNLAAPEPRGGNALLEVIQKISSVLNPSSAPSNAEALPLPVVSQGELTIRRNGAKTYREFMAEVAQRSREVSFSKSEFDALIKRPDRRILRPTELIDRALQERSFGGIEDSLRILIDFFSKKQDELLTSIPVAEEGTMIAQNIIGMERLTMELMLNAQAVATGKMSEDNFRSLYEKYKNTARAVQEKIAELPPTRAPSFAERIEQKISRAWNAAFWFLTPAFAQMGGTTSPFGGDVQEVSSDNCYCSGEEVTLSQNYVQGGATDFLYSYAVMFSGTYSNYAVEQNTCVLGTYTQSGTCVYGEYCDETETVDGTISLIGTAQSGSQCSSSGSSTGSAGAGF